MRRRGDPESEIPDWVLHAGDVGVDRAERERAVDWGREHGYGLIDIMRAQRDVRLGGIQGGDDAA